jgi:hypothetical protein
MSGKKQKAAPPHQFKASTRALTMIAAVAALAVSAAPVASAGPAKKPPPRAAWVASHEYGHINHINASGGWDPTLRSSRQAAVLYNGHAGLGANAQA